jgi:hypothetical protein
MTEMKLRQEGFCDQNNNQLADMHIFKLTDIANYGLQC